MTIVLIAGAVWLLVVLVVVGVCRSAAQGDTDAADHLSLSLKYIVAVNERRPL